MALPEERDLIPLGLPQGDREKFVAQAQAAGLPLGTGTSSEGAPPAPQPTPAPASRRIAPPPVDLSTFDALAGRQPQRPMLTPAAPSRNLILQDIASRVSNPVMLRVIEQMLDEE